MVMAAQILVDWLNQGLCLICELKIATTIGSNPPKMAKPRPHFAGDVSE